MRKILLIVFFLICDKTTSTTQRHAENGAPKNWKLGECLSPLKLTVFGRRIGPKLKKLEGFFSGRGIRRISNQEV